MQGIQVARDVHRQVNLKEMACLDSSLLLLPPHSRRVFAREAF